MPEQFTQGWTVRAIKRRLRTVEHKLRVQRVKLACLNGVSAVKRNLGLHVRSEISIKKRIAELQCEIEDLKLELLVHGLSRLRVKTGKFKYYKLCEEKE